ncbi:Nucleotide-binding protein [Nannochloropsis gaditana]|uniref:Nucleotide-binding protein n=1 Tax=Nannochloropsis gaditana TaxID=72520 RepID=W7U659_9STRA|nr:Nucleotide-binding protein [Nannochloropsis gaditana]
MAGACACLVFFETFGHVPQSLEDLLEPVRLAFIASSVHNFDERDNRRGFLHVQRLVRWYRAREQGSSSVVPGHGLHRLPGRPHVLAACGKSNFCGDIAYTPARHLFPSMACPPYYDRPTPNPGGGRRSRQGSIASIPVSHAGHSSPYQRDTSDGRPQASSPSYGPGAGEETVGHYPPSHHHPHPSHFSRPGTEGPYAEGMTGRNSSPRQHPQPPSYTVPGSTHPYYPHHPSYGLGGGPGEMAMPVSEHLGHYRVPHAYHGPPYPDNHPPPHHANLPPPHSPQQQHGFDPAHRPSPPRSRPAPGALICPPPAINTSLASSTVSSSGMHSYPAHPYPAPHVTSSSVTTSFPDVNQATPAALTVTSSGGIPLLEYVDREGSTCIIYEVPTAFSEAALACAGPEGYPPWSPGAPIQTVRDGDVVTSGPDGCNLFVFHLPSNFSNADCFNLFSAYGTIISVRIMVEKGTGRSRGFGFVSFDSETAAELAIEMLDGYQLGHKRLKVQHKKMESPSVCLDEEGRAGRGGSQEGGKEGGGEGGREGRGRSWHHGEAYEAPRPASQASDVTFSSSSSSASFPHLPRGRNLKDGEGGRGIYTSGYRPPFQGGRGRGAGGRGPASSYAASSYPPYRERGGRGRANAFYLPPYPHAPLEAFPPRYYEPPYPSYADQSPYPPHLPPHSHPGAGMPSSTPPHYSPYMGGGDLPPSLPPSLPPPSYFPSYGPLPSRSYAGEGGARGEEGEMAFYTHGYPSAERGRGRGWYRGRGGGRGGGRGYFRVSAPPEDRYHRLSSHSSYRQGRADTGKEEEGREGAGEGGREGGVDRPSLTIDDLSGLTLEGNEEAEGGREEGPRQGMAEVEEGGEGEEGEPWEVASPLPGGGGGEGGGEGEGGTKGLTAGDQTPRPSSTAAGSTTTSPGDG